MRAIARIVKRRLLNALNPGRKSNSELNFWQTEITRYQQWYQGELKQLYSTRSPAAEQKIAAPNLKDSSILTWHKLHQEVKYLCDLRLDAEAFRGKRLLDIGSGPIPSGTCFRGAQLYCLDPLIPDYVTAGFPLHYYDDVHFVHGSSENMPLANGFFDAIIAVNSIDHVDDIQKTAQEIRRVLKPDGLIRMHVHYHRATITEPLELDDVRVSSLFSWCNNFKKIGAFSENSGGKLPADEEFALWSNF